MDNKIDLSLWQTYKTHYYEFKNICNSRPERGAHLAMLILESIPVFGQLILLGECLRRSFRPVDLSQPNAAFLPLNKLAERTAAASLEVLGSNGDSSVGRGNIAGLFESRDKGALVTATRDLYDIIIMDNTQQEGRVYRLTIPVLCASQLGDTETFLSCRKEIEKCFGFEESHNLSSDQWLDKSKTWGEKTNENLWLLGRVLVAAKPLQNQFYYAQQLEQFLTEMLMPQQSTEPSSGELASKGALTPKVWALGYLASVKGKENPKIFEELSRQIDQLKKIDPSGETHYVKGAIVLHIAAAAKAGNREVYEAQLQNLLKWTKMNNLEDAINTIPVENFRAWAFSMVGLAAGEIGDLDNLRALARPTEDAITESSDESDRLLAEITWNAGQQYHPVSDDES